MACIPNSLPDLGAIPVTREHRQARVPRKSRIGARQFAQRECTPARARDPRRVGARSAQSFPRGLPGVRPIVHDGLMFTSESVTRGVRVSVLSEYDPERSRPNNQQWFFLYTITITNESTD